MSNIAIKGEKVILNNVVLGDSVIVGAFERAKKQKQDLDTFLRKTLRTGILVNATTADDSKIHETATKITQWVCEELDKRTKNTDAAGARLEEIFAAFQDEIKKDAETRHRLMNSLTTAGIVAAASKPDMAQQGRDYEKELSETLGEIASYYGVAGRPVGKESGKIGEQGDYVIDFEEGSVVFEIKKGAELGKKDKHNIKEIRESLANSVENHNAQYGIFLTKDAANLPPSIHTAGVIDNDLYMVCAMEENGTPLPESFLRMICTMARLRIKARKHSSSANIAKIQRSCKEAQDALNNTFIECKKINAATRRMKDKTLNTIELSLESILAATRQQDDAT